MGIFDKKGKYKGNASFATYVKTPGKPARKG